jgi:hypothetical protein
MHFLSFEKSAIGPIVLTTGRSQRRNSVERIVESHFVDGIGRYSDCNSDEYTYSGRNVISSDPLGRYGSLSQEQVYCSSFPPKAVQNSGPGARRSAQGSGHRGKQLGTRNRRGARSAFQLSLQDFAGE